MYLKVERRTRNKRCIRINQVRIFIINHLEVPGMRIATRIVDWFSIPYSLYLLIKAPDTSWKAKLKAGTILAVLFFYLLDPIDIIPDVVPILGWLDDVVIIHIANAVAGKVVPEINVTAIRQKARASTRRILFWALVIITAMVVISLTVLGLLIYLAIRKWA